MACGTFAPRRPLAGQKGSWTLSSVGSVGRARIAAGLQIADRSVVESREAVLKDPGSAPARESLFEALRRKVGVLQATVTLMNEMRKGNQTGAAEAAAAFGKKS